MLKLINGRLTQVDPAANIKKSLPWIIAGLALISGYLF